MSLRQQNPWVLRLFPESKPSGDEVTLLKLPTFIEDMKGPVRRMWTGPWLHHRYSGVGRTRLAVIVGDSFQGRHIDCRGIQAPEITKAAEGSDTQRIRRSQRLRLTWVVGSSYQCQHDLDHESTWLRMRTTVTRDLRRKVEL